MEINKIYQGDCLELMKQIEDNSIDCIITDPPYGTIKGLGGDIEKYKLLSNSTWDEIINPIEMFNECERILKKAGKLILFSQEPYTSKLITEAHNNLLFSYRLIWLKDHFANCLVVNKAPVSYFEDIIVFNKKNPKYDFEGLHPLRIYFKKVLDYIGLNLKQINNKLGNRKAEHSFYVTPKKAIMEEIGQKADHTFKNGSTQFSLCTKETYEELIKVFEIDKMEGFIEYKKLEGMNEEFRKTLDFDESTFNLWEGKKLKSNVLQYKKDYGGLHPTQKPVLLCEDLIKTYSNKGDLILDFTIGSGTTAIACIRTNRNYIGIELSEEYCKIANERIQKELFQSKLNNEVGIPPKPKVLGILANFK